MSGIAGLEEAVQVYRAALVERPRERVPLDWATTQSNLGNALVTLGKALFNLGRREEGNARLEEAVAAYRAALLEWTRERAPLDWAMTRTNLGRALATLGERDIISWAPTDEVRDGELLPQAVVRGRIDELCLELDAQPESGSDGLDDYEGAVFHFGDGTRFALKHYRGHPPGTVTIYLQPEIGDVLDISETVGRVLAGLGLERDSLIWHRAQDPEL